MAVSYIGADVHSKTTDLAVERNGKIVKRLVVETTIPALRKALASVHGQKMLTFEEGPMAHWLWRELRGSVDELIVCEPRRNRLISEDGDHGDPIDAEKLAVLLRGGYLRPVHQCEDDHQLLRQWVGLYHDRVHRATAEVNKLRARCRMFGIRTARGVLRDPARRAAWIEDLSDSPLADQLVLLWKGFDVVAEQVAECRSRLIELGRPYEIIGYWQELPGVGLIRATTVYAYLDTPWRFASNPSKLWKYCGVGLKRASSGRDKQGRLLPGHLQLAWQVNRRLKDAVMGAATSAIRMENNVFAAMHERLVTDGLTFSNARHTVARKMLSVMWGMWKTLTRFDERLVHGCLDVL